MGPQRRFVFRLPGCSEKQSVPRSISANGSRNVEQIGASFNEASARIALSAHENPYPQRAIQQRFKRSLVFGCPEHARGICAHDWIRIMLLEVYAVARSHLSV